MLYLQKRFEKGTENYELFNDFWKLRQQYYQADNDNEWFAEMMNTGEKIIEKYQNTELSKLARSLIFAHFEDVEDRWKEGRRSEQ